jgi:hypothetical protein
MFLPRGWLIPVLPPDRGIDLRKQRGGDLDEGYAALVACRGEAGEVADDATAEGNDGRGTIATRGQQGIEDLVQRFPGLVGLAIRQDDRRHADADFCQPLTPAYRDTAGAPWCC